MSIKEGFLGREVQGEDLVCSFEQQEYRKLRKERPVYVGGNMWLLDGGKEETNPEKEGRRTLVTGRSCSSTSEGYVVVSRNDSNKDRKTFQLPRRLCWMMERRE